MSGASQDKECQRHSINQPTGCRVLAATLGSPNVTSNSEGVASDLRQKGSAIAEPEQVTNIAQ
jgi:hypothetical protein